jgi:hypothetical protein
MIVGRQFIAWNAAPPRPVPLGYGMMGFYPASIYLAGALVRANEISGCDVARGNHSYRTLTGRIFAGRHPRQ